MIIKPDQSPVTEIDRKVETELRRLVENKFPDHGIIGEEFGDVRVDVGDQVALQGNLDPCVLYASPEVIRQEVAAVLESYGRGHGHVFNLVHGIHPNIDPDNVAVFIASVHTLSAKYHGVNH